jgi:hypothetical protein
VSSFTFWASSVSGISSFSLVAHIVSDEFDNISLIRFPVIWASCRTSPSIFGFFSTQCFNTYASVFEAKDVELKTVRDFVLTHLRLM